MSFWKKKHFYTLCVGLSVYMRSLHDINSSISRRQFGQNQKIVDPRTSSYGMVEKKSHWTVMLIAQGFCGKRVSVLRHPPFLLWFLGLRRIFWHSLSEPEFVNLLRSQESIPSLAESIPGCRHWSTRPPNTPPPHRAHIIRIYLLSLHILEINYPCLPTR